MLPSEIIVDKKSKRIYNQCVLQEEMTIMYGPK